MLHQGGRETVVTMTTGPPLGPGSRSLLHSSGASLTGGPRAEPHSGPD